jgi:hypothetical protein
MIGRKRLLRVTAVLSVALATGQAVESLRSSAGVSPEAAAGGIAAQNERLPSSASLAGAGQLPDLIGITSVAAANQRPQSDSCTPSLTLSAGEGATIDLALFAPCDPGERIVIRHSGLSFTALMGRDGQLSLSLPALEKQALVAAYFEGSAVALATVEVPDVAENARFAFQVPYPVEFELRAEEGGTIHVGGNPAPQRITSGRIVTLGSEAVAQPMIAQVYTFPGNDLGSSDLSVEVRITDQTCSRSFLAESRLSQGGAVVARTLPIAVPICGTSGDILVLKNLVPDPTLAAPR